MDTAQIKERILECAKQQGKDVSPGRSVVAVSNRSGYNVRSYPDDMDAEKHALGAAAAFERSEPTPIIYVIINDTCINQRM